jgi:hypothetical protein
VIKIELEFDNLDDLNMVVTLYGITRGISNEREPDVVSIAETNSFDEILYLMRDNFDFFSESLKQLNGKQYIYKVVKNDNV